MQYSNPRMKAEFDEWPYGSQRVKCIFEVEQTPRGERATRYTIDPRTGQPNKAKKLTFADKVRLVDGDDGKIYILNKSRHFNMIIIMQSNMQFQQEAIHENDPRFPELLKFVKTPEL